MTGKKKHVGFTDHALLRYVERVMGVDIEQLKEEILPGHHKLMIKEDCKITKNGYTLVVRGNSVVTVITE